MEMTFGTGSLGAVISQNRELLSLLERSESVAVRIEQNGKWSTGATGGTGYTVTRDYGNLARAAETAVDRRLAIYKRGSTRATSDSFSARGSAKELRGVVELAQGNVNYHSVLESAETLEAAARKLGFHRLENMLGKVMSGAGFLGGGMVYAHMGRQIINEQFERANEFGVAATHAQSTWKNVWGNMSKGAQASAVRDIGLAAQRIDGSVIPGSEEALERQKKIAQYGEHVGALLENSRVGAGALNYYRSGVGGFGRRLGAGHNALRNALLESNQLQDPEALKRRQETIAAAGKYVEAMVKSEKDEKDELENMRESDPAWAAVQKSQENYLNAAEKQRLREMNDANWF